MFKYRVTSKGNIKTDILGNEHAAEIIINLKNNADVNIQTGIYVLLILLVLDILSEIKWPIFILMKMEREGIEPSLVLTPLQL